MARFPVLFKVGFAKHGDALVSAGKRKPSNSIQGLLILGGSQPSP